MVPRSSGTQGWRSEQSHHHARSNPKHRFLSPEQSSNIYATLTDERHENTEVNAHIAERFSGASLNYQSVDDHNSPVSKIPRIVGDVSSYFQVGKKPIDGGEWLDQTEIPSTSELFCEQTSSTSKTSRKLIEVKSNICGHKAYGEYEDKEDYLRTKYELLREDAIRPLREAVNKVRKDPFQDEVDYGDQSIGVYDPVYITSLVFSPRGIATRVAFSLSRVKKHIRWDHSKRLVTGALVALSPAEDSFKTQCILATVAARPTAALDQNPPEIDLFFARSNEQEVDPMKKWVMVECRSSYFEASRHTLFTLQHMMRESFPLSEHLVKMKKEVDAPEYVKNNPFVDLSCLADPRDKTPLENVDVFSDWPNIPSASLDNSQTAALKRMLTAKLALVQGPPGTGKTYVSVKAVRVMLMNLRTDDSPIIVTAQTNHAVDQILRHIMEFEPAIIRLGGRSTHAEIKKRTLYELRQEMPGRRTDPGRLRAIKAKKLLDKDLLKLLAPLEANTGPLDHQLLSELSIITNDQAQSLEVESQFTTSSQRSSGIMLEQWLGRSLISSPRPMQPDDYSIGFENDDFEVEQPQEVEAEAVQDEDDFETLHGPRILISDNYKGRVSPSSPVNVREVLYKTQDLYTIPPADRGAIYNFFMCELKRILLPQVRQLAKSYENNTLSQKIGRFNEDLPLLSKARIIGCTTTGLSKYRAMLVATKPRVIIVEEAAETQEAPVTAACMPSVEHLILVGDHLQLRPHTQVRDFEDEPYFLNLSLFERLINNEIMFSVLQRQRRMIPEVRSLLRPIYRHQLRDHPSVENPKNRPPVEGMGGKNSYFFHHTWKEDRDVHKSALNAGEADMVVNFFAYLVVNNIDPASITVLTFYNGQRKLISNKMQKHELLKFLTFSRKVVTVDSYQGEENDIVLLSLVRSGGGSIGFLSSENRVCVALSRARRGFYLFGNACLLATESHLWAEVVKILIGDRRNPQTRRIGFNLPIQCSNHNRKQWMKDPSDFDHINGGCDRPCGAILLCGHQCPKRCHPTENSKVEFKEPCSRFIDGCGHSCTENCGQPCRCKKCENRKLGSNPLRKLPCKATASSQSLTSPARITHPVSNFRYRGDGSFSASTSQESVVILERDAYASDDVQKEDAQMKGKLKKQQIQFSPSRKPARDRTHSSKVDRLIDIAAEEVLQSPNKKLLIDLGEETATEMKRNTMKQKANHANIASKSKDDGDTKNSPMWLD